MAKSGDKGEVTNRQSVDSKKIPLPLESNGKPKCQVGGIRVGIAQNPSNEKPKCQVGGIRVGLHKIHPTGKFVQNIGSQLIF